MQDGTHACQALTRTAMCLHAWMVVEVHGQAKVTQLQGALLAEQDVAWTHAGCNGMVKHCLHSCIFVQVALIWSSIACIHVHTYADV